MIFSVVLFALTGIIAFFLYTQGAFSAIISAILATFAAALALGWYEPLAQLLFATKLYDEAASISVVLIFAAAYLIPRLIIDSFVPGNVRLPFIVDKVLSGVAGLIAGLMAAGIVAIAADALPFGPTLGMYSRFETADSGDIEYMGNNGQMQDSKAADMIKADKIDPDDSTKAHVWFGQDDLVVSLAKHLSDPSGSLTTDHPFTDFHPDFLDELYAQRIGIQTGAKHSAVSTDQSQAVSLGGVYTPPFPIPQIDGETHEMRNSTTPPPAVVTPEADQIVLVVRLSFNGRDLADGTDNLMRFSASSIRLVTGVPDNGAPIKNYYAVATLDGRGVAVADRPDDFLFADTSASRTLDFVFIVDRDHVISGDETKPPFHLPPGIFVEFKRYAAFDLTGKTVDFGPPPNKDKTPIFRPVEVGKTLDKTDGIWTGATPPAGSVAESPSAPGAAPPAPSGDETAGTPPAETPAGRAMGDSGLSYEDIAVSNKLPAPINCGTGNDSGAVQLPSGVGGQLQARKWTQLTLSADTTVEQLGTPIDDNIQTLAVTPNTVLVQVHCSPPVSGSASKILAWGKNIADFELADAVGKTYPCVGAWATVQRTAQHYMVANFKSFDDQQRLQPLPTAKGRPVDVWLAFEVPSGTRLFEIRYNANTVVDNLAFTAQ